MPLGRTLVIVKIVILLLRVVAHYVPAVYEGWIRLRNTVLSALYMWLARPLLFLLDPEAVHGYFQTIGWLLNSNFVSRHFVAWAFYFEAKNQLSQTLTFRTAVPSKLPENSFGDHGLELRTSSLSLVNPVGLAAGFDEGACLALLMRNVGFGFVESGSFSGAPSAGATERPRLWRIVKEEALLVHYGMRNPGSARVADSCHIAKDFTQGFNVAPANVPSMTTVEEAIADVSDAFFALHEKADYLVINLMAVNTVTSFRPFETISAVRQLLRSLVSDARLQHVRHPKPLLLKVNRDLGDDWLVRLVRLAHDCALVGGFICCHLSSRKGDESRPGALSGKPILADTVRAVSVVSREARKLQEKSRDGSSPPLVVVAVGGISTAQDVWEVMSAGASCVQLFTSMIFRGPTIISEINCELIRMLREHGKRNVREIVGQGLSSEFVV